MSEPVDGRVILEFRDGELVGVTPIAMSDEQATSLLQQLQQAAVGGDFTRIRDDESR